MRSRQVREKNIDIIKAIGIVLMVYGHCGLPGTHFIYLFHMALFFIASGYFFSTNKSADIRGLCHYIIRKFKSLWVPYVIFNGTCALLNNFFIRVNIYTNNPQILTFGKDFHVTGFYSGKQLITELLHIVAFRGGTELGNATWFLYSLFETAAVYAVVAYLCRKLSKKSRLITNAIFAALLLTCSYVLTVNNHSLHGYQLIGFTYILYYEGEVFHYISKWYKQHGKLFHLLIFATSLCIEFLLNSFGSIDISQNMITNPAYFIGASTFGFLMIYEVSNALCYFASDLIIAKFQVLGQNTLAILLFHFSSFKIVNAFQVFVCKLPTFLIAAFPTLHGDSAWGILFLLAGVMIPLILSIEYKKLKSIIAAKRRKTCNE